MEYPSSPSISQFARCCFRFAVLLTVILPGSAMVHAAGVDHLSPAIRSLNLDGTWQLTYGRIKSVDTLKQDLTAPPADDTTIPATVPGNVELDMIAAGKLEDPTIGLRARDLLKLEPYQWWYRRTFQTPKLDNGDKAELVFDGLDCLGTVWVNGKLAGRAADMFIPYRFDVTSLLRPAGNDNEVLVRIDPAATVAEQTPHYPGELGDYWGQGKVRKAPEMYGWDVVPRIVSAGLWRDVHLDLVRPTHINSIYWSTVSVDVPKKTADLMLQWTIATDRLDLHVNPLRTRFMLTRNGKVAFKGEGPTVAPRGFGEVQLKNVDFWWPRGYGDPALYNATFTLMDDAGKMLDEKTTRVGIRTVNLHFEDINPPKNPGDFCYFVNGQRIFMRGVNWGVLDSFPSRNVQRMKEVGPLLAGLNCNMIRNWGPNTPAPDQLYDLCDENGIMILQEFPIANQILPQDDAFKEVMKTEAEGIIERLRNHASIAAWCGGNEFDGAWGWMRARVIDDNAFDGITRGVFPNAVIKMDPCRDYMPCCPLVDSAAVHAYKESNSPWAHEPGVEIATFAPPDNHQYKTEPPEGIDYKGPTNASLFVSETGYDGLPSVSSIKRMMDPECVYPWIGDDQTKWNEEWRYKCSPIFGPSELDTLSGEVKGLFTEMPKDLDNFVLATQIAQAEADKFFVERSRVRKGDPSGPVKFGDRWGVLVFSLQAGWPMINFTVVDYYNVKRLAYDYLQESMRDVQAICGEAENGQHPVIIVNDTLKPAHGSVTVTCLGEATPLLQTDFTIGANGKATVGSIPEPKEARMWKIEWKLDDGPKYQSHYLAYHSHIQLKDYVGWMKELGFAMHESASK